MLTTSSAQFKPGAIVLIEYRFSGFNYLGEVDGNNHIRAFGKWRNDIPDILHRCEFLYDLKMFLPPIYTLHLVFEN